MDKKINIVIMAGGTGTRFWPYSRNKNPKQFLDVLNTGKSLLQMTYDRFIEHVPKDQIWIVSNVMYRELISVQIPDLLLRSNIIGTQQAKYCSLYRLCGL